MVNEKKKYFHSPEKMFTAENSWVNLLSPPSFLNPFNSKHNLLFHHKDPELLSFQTCIQAVSVTDLINENENRNRPPDKRD